MTDIGESYDLHLAGRIGKCGTLVLRKPKLGHSLVQIWNTPRLNVQSLIVKDKA